MGIRQNWKLMTGVNLAAFKEWAMEISAGWTAAGWTRSADTGQVDWSAIAAPPVAGSYVYEIWRSTDALSATCPMYVKIEYGHSGASNYTPVMYITAGTSTDGAGNITGNVFARNGYVNSVSTSQTWHYEIDCAWYGSGSSFAFLLGRDTGNWLGVRLFAIERSHDANGNDTDEYFTVVDMVSNAFKQQSVFKPGSAAPAGPPETSYVNVLLPSGRWSGESLLVTGNNVHVSPVYPQVGRLGNPMTLLLFGSAADLSEDVVINTTLYGATHNYLTSKGCYYISYYIVGGSNTYAYRGYGLRWDAGA